MKYEPRAGDRINDSCVEAVRMAVINNCEVEFDFNDQKLIATPNSDPTELAASYMAESQRRHDEYIASDKYKRQQEEAKSKQQEHNTSLKEALAVAPEHMSLRDGDGWKTFCEKNTDPYGGAVVTYAERWARLMEAEMAKGLTLEGVADACSHLADNEGITGFMYGCAVSTLAQVWLHGEGLRRWHNIRTQIQNEGEIANEKGTVLNPALLSFG